MSLLLISHFTLLTSNFSLPYSHFNLHTFFSLDGVFCFCPGNENNLQRSCANGFPNSLGFQPKDSWPGWPIYRCGYAALGG